MTTKGDYVVAYPSTSNEKFGKHKPNEDLFRSGVTNKVSGDMLSYGVEQPELYSTDMFCFAQRYDKDYYRSKFPLFDDYALNILEWSSAEQLDELMLRYKVKKRQDKIKQRRELKKKLDTMGKRVNSKKMKKIKKKIILTF